VIMATPLNVLIIEDSDDDAALLLRLLRRGGYDPVSETVDNMEDLIAELGRRTWEVILSDYALPKFSAQEALEIVNNSGLDLPFIIVSGAVGEDAAVAMMKAGANDYLRKDNLARLVAAIERELRDSAERRKRKLAEAQVHQYEKQLRSMASELSLAEERQRRLLANDLHDGIGQYLVLAQIKLGAMRKLAEASGALPQLEEIRSLLNHAIWDTRNLTTQLSPPILYDLGLEAALKWLGENVQNQHHIRFQFQGHQGDRNSLSTDLKVVLFQSVRELLNNIVRHAHAISFKVCIFKENSHLRITVEDDGVGFDHSAIDPHYHKDGSFGLFSVRERMKSLGGDLTIDSEPGRGTQVTLIAPIVKIGQAGDEVGNGPRKAPESSVDSPREWSRK